jgi:hypothetical protein
MVELIESRKARSGQQPGYAEAAPGVGLG